MGNGKTRFLDELRQNKAKAAVLVVTVAVALYYWVPLLKKFSRNPAPTPPATPVAGVASSSASENPGAATAEFSWDAFQEWKRESEWMQPAAWSSARGNPFANLLTADATAEDARPSAPLEHTSAPTPSQLGLVPRGIICSSRGKWVNFQGELYGIGEHVSVKDGTGQTIRFHVTAIFPDYVELERNGERFRVELTTDKPPRERLMVSRTTE